MNQAGVINCAKSGGKFSCHERSGGYPDAKDRNAALWLSDRASSTNFGGSPQNAGRTRLESDHDYSFFYQTVAESRLSSNTFGTKQHKAHGNRRRLLFETVSSNYCRN